MFLEQGALIFLLELQEAMLNLLAKTKANLDFAVCSKKFQKSKELSVFGCFIFIQTILILTFCL